MEKISWVDGADNEWWSAAESPRKQEHLGHSTAVQTQMDRTHPEGWFTATGHNVGQDVGQRNERTKASANAQRHHKRTASLWREKLGVDLWQK